MTPALLHRMLHEFVIDATNPKGMTSQPITLSSKDYSIDEEDVLGSSPMAIIFGGELVHQNHDHSEYNQLVAIKIAKDTVAKQLIRHEAEIYHHLSHCPDALEFVVDYHGYDNLASALVLTRMNITLEECIKQAEQSPIRPQKLQDIFRPLATRIVQALMWLHTIAGVVHGDIKPSNFLLRYNPFTSDPVESPIDIVLSDFGAARRFEQDIINTGGNTWEYMAPERMNFRASQTPSTKEADVWALAISLLVVITGRVPYEGISGPRQRAMIAQGDPISFQMNDSLELQTRIEESQDLIRLIHPGLRKDPESRIKAENWYDNMVEG